ncbi:MAG: ABC transporter substrate-binding protein [Alphaproteobacteria bacterium]|nr:ABC transporter substrate-binding protein [Alphaproteobacteria bacterium]
MRFQRVFMVALLTSVSCTSFNLDAHAFTETFTGNYTPSIENRIFVSQDEKIQVGAKKFIDTLAQDGIGFLSDDSLSEDQRKEKFREFLLRNFDMNAIGRFALGRYWKTSSPQEQKEYLNLFEDMIVDIYSKRFSDYNGEAIIIESSRPEGKSDTIVTSSIVPASGQKIRVDWRIRYKKDQYKVIDVMVEGVSMALTQRSDFASVIQRGGGKVEVLLAHLRMK